MTQLSSATVIQHISQLKESQTDTAASYFYFDFNDTEKQSSRKAVRSLLFQLAPQVHDGLPLLEQLYQKCASGQQQPTEPMVRSLFQDIIDRIKSKYIILDALDECTDREAFLGFLHELVNSSRQGLHLMVTSRREGDIENHLSAIANHSINIQNTAVDEDIRAYIHDQLATDTKLKKWSPEVHDEIITVMVEKAGGMYGYLMTSYTYFANHRIGFAGYIVSLNLFDHAST